MNRTSEHRAIEELATKLVEEEINPHAAEWEQDRQLPSREVFKKFGTLGLLGINKPADIGGLGLDYSYHAVFVETLGRLSSTGVGLAIGIQTDMATPALARHGSRELQEEFLGPSIAGERIAAIGVSEIAGGSDLVAIKTTAKRDGDDYIINGGKMWTTNGVQADWICLLANTSSPPSSSPNRNLMNKSLICVPMKTKGITISRKLDKLGMHSSDTAQIFLDDVRVPVRNRIGREGMGFAYQMKQFCDERLFICLSTIASMRDTIAQTIEYTSMRKTFGKPVLSNQHVQFVLSDLSARVEAQHALAWRAVDQYVAGKDVALVTAMLKLNTGRLVRDVNDQCLQFWGGMGFMNENIVARRYRDQRLVSIGGGTDEVMLQIISNYLNLDAKIQEAR